MALTDLSIYYTWKNIKKLYNNNKFKISAPPWSDELDLPDGSYSISDIQDYFEYIIKKHETIADDPLVQIYLNKIKNGIFLKNKDRLYIKTFIRRNNEIIRNLKKRC